MPFNKIKLPELHLLTFFGIVFMLMLTENSYAKVLMAMNMFFVSTYVLLMASTQLKWQNWKIYTAVIITFLIHLHCIDTKQWDGLIALDILLIYGYCLFSSQHNSQYVLKPLIVVLVFPAIFSLLHWLAIGKIELEKNALNIWFCTYLTLGIWVLAKQDTSFLNKYFSKLVIVLLLLYSVSQSIGIIEKLNAYGTTKNPHYLALYSAFAFCISIYFAMTRGVILRWVMIINAAILGYFILMSSSRPVWIAMAFSTVFLFIFATKRQRILVFSFVLLTQAILFSTNVADYRSRFYELASNITHEERVPIWQNAITLQGMSTPKEWIIGHGVDRFRPLFAQYSTFNSPTKFHSPHNLFLDVVFTFGILGIITVGVLYYLLYKYCFVIQKIRPDLRSFSCLLLTILTINLLFNAINMPFFSKFNIFQIGLIGGIILFIFERAQVVSRHQTNAQGLRGIKFSE